MLDGNPISTSQRMVAKSDGAYDMNVEADGKTIHVKYKFDGAEFDMPNEVTVNTRIDRWLDYLPCRILIFFSNLFIIIRNGTSAIYAI